MALKAGVRGLGKSGVAVAAAALCIGAGGTAVAAKMVTGKVVKNGSLTGIDIRNKSLTKKDFRGSIRGARGPAGVRGATGPTGAAGATSVVIRQGSPTNFSSGAPGVATASCQQGERAVGGGANAAGEADNAPTGAAQVIESYPTPLTAGGTPTGWAVAMTKSTAGTDTATAYVICASP